MVEFTEVNVDGNTMRIAYSSPGGEGGVGYAMPHFGEEGGGRPEGKRTLSGRA